jgi:Na+/melibiose symporter-like transporter
MTIETAVVVFAAGIIIVVLLIIIVVLLIWYTHRLTNRRLAKIQSDLDALHQASQWLLVKGLNRESDGPARSEPVEKSTPRRRDR